MVNVIDRLEAKKSELEVDLGNLSNWGSQDKKILKRKIKSLEELIIAYRQLPSSGFDLNRTKEILDQHYGFEEQKEKILENLKIWRYSESRGGNKFSPFIICLLGPAGIGKTTFVKIIAQSLNKKFFSLNLGGASNSGILMGSEQWSAGNDMGKLARALIETNSPNPLILLDEIDKVKSTTIHDAFLVILDRTQNQEVYDQFLETKLDFSQVTFVATANDLEKIPSYLLSRLEVVELNGYDSEQKKKIAEKIIQKELEKWNIDSGLLEISSESLDILISKTHEKGVRQLGLGIKNIFDHCLLRWAEQEGREEKITITPDLVEKIVPRDFINIDQEETKDQQIERMQKELSAFQRERIKNEQTKLSLNKIQILRVIEEKLKNANLKKENLDLDEDYETRIKQAISSEELEITKEEVLLKIAQKSTGKMPKNNYFTNYQQIVEKEPKDNSNKKDKEIEKMEEKLANLIDERKDLKNQASAFQRQLNFQSQEIQSLKSQVSERSKFDGKVEKKLDLILLILFFGGIIILVILGIKRFWKVKKRII